MGKETEIEWCDSSFNAWEGCTKVGPGCDNCYAEARNGRFHAGENWGAGAPRRLRSDAYWREPLKWERDHENFKTLYGRRRRVFCSSLADVFDNEAPDGQRDRLWELIRATPHLDWLLLTKRIGNVKGMLPANWGDNSDWGDSYPNVWIGATMVNQEELDRDMDKLLAVHARVRFVSLEPLLGSVDLSRWLFPFKSCGDCPCQNPERSMEGFHNCCRDPELLQSQLHWVIVGGESGPGARPAREDDVLEIRDQCAAASVPMLFKQWGEWMPTIRNGDNIELRFPIGAPTGPSQPQFHDWPDGAGAARVGKRAAGRLLDGVQHDGYPVVD